MADKHVTFLAFVVAALLAAPIAGQRPASSATSWYLGRNAGTRVVEGHDNFVVGRNAGVSLINQSGVVLIGDGADTSRDSEVVIRFTDGTEFRASLPRGKRIALEGVQEDLMDSQRQAVAACEARAREHERIIRSLMRPFLTGHDNTLLSPKSTATPTPR